MRVCVVGAGASGIVMVKELLEAGHTPICVEASSKIGGVFVKSYDNTIEIFSEGKPLKKRVMKIVTDSKEMDEPKDPDTDKTYYTMGPGLATDAVKLLEEKQIVLVALDNPFTDPVRNGQLQGKAPPPDGTPPGLPFMIHHYNLVKSGIHQIQNANLAAMAADKVWTSCTIILPLRSKGGSGSPVRPVAIGAPG